MVWAPDYVTAAQLKSYVSVDHDDIDVWLANWATAVSRNVDGFTGRQFGQVATAEARTYSPIWDCNERRSYFEIDDLQDTTGFTFTDDSGTLIAAADYRLEPRNAVAKGSVYTRISVATHYTDDATFVGKWGWNAVPASIPTAAYIQASRLAARKNSPFGVAGSPTTGTEIRLLAQLDVDFKTTLAPFVRKWYMK